MWFDGTARTTVPVPIAVSALAIIVFAFETKFQNPIFAAPHNAGSPASVAGPYWRSTMRNLETSAFGAAALVAQALVIAAIIVA